MSTETPKQTMRRLLGRMKLTPEQHRVIDRFIEELPDEDAETFIAAMQEMEQENPGTIESFIEEINENGIPDD